MIRTATLLGALTLGLAACSGGTEQSQSQAGQIQTLYQALRNAARTPDPVPQLTPALIEALPVSTLELVVEDRGATVYLIPFSDRTDNRPGALRTWRSADDVHFVLRQGVLIATRGLGTNLGSANVSSSVAAVLSRTPQPGGKSLYLRNGDHGTDRIDLTCTMQSDGAQSLSIVGTRRDTVKLREECQHDGSIVTNEYWVGARGATVWQSRQWAGPDLGYVRTRLLKE